MAQQKQFDFIKNEHQVLDWWYQKGVVQKYLHRNDRAKKKFSFLDGPITANNPMGVHHAWGRTLKDIYQRYKNMQGYRQRFQNGFDCQGLWVEVEVEKEKGFRSKKDIEKYGIGKFVEDCKARVRKYSQIQTQQSIRLGYFMDWNHSYYTMSEENNYMIWHFLKKAWQEGLIYKGNDAVPWCPRCGTAISQQEISEGGHQLRTHQAVFMRFPVIRTGQPAAKNEFLLVWTTTPWTIPADTLVAAHPEIQYARVEWQGNHYWLAKKLIPAVFGQDLTPKKVVTGQQLIDQEKISHYQAPFAELPIIKKMAKNPHFHALVLSKDLVNEEEGTGLVHIVPGAGTEDHQLVKKELGWSDVIFPVVDEEGNYLPGYGPLSGKNAKKHPELIIDYLRQKDGGRYFFRTQAYTHPYPVCWRCGTELIWRLVDEWYIAMDQKTSTGKTLRQRMIAVAKKIHWIPGFGLKRELDWLKNMGDWMISKKRYWGLSLPIWECPHCGHFEVIGSREELEKRAVKGWAEFAGHSPHRPWIDKVQIRCPKCGHLMRRVPDVGNPWLDAGIVPFSTLIDPKTGQVSYLGDKKYWRQWFPADLVLECFPGQFRNWFYSLIAMATLLEDTNPYRTLLGHALVRDEKGEEMHKSKGNAIWFDEAAEKMGVDTMRWLFARQKPEFNLNFGYHIADEVRRQYLFLYWNSYRFFKTYAQLHRWQPPKRATPHQPSVLDQWILSRLETTKKLATKHLDAYHHQEALWAIEKFLEDLSTWYIRRSRDRVNFLPDQASRQQKEAARRCLATLHYVLSQTTLLLAPFIPFLSETVWQNLRGHEKQWSVNDSVHLQDWPSVQEKLINTQLEKQMAAVREIVSLGHAQRKEKQIKLRQPLARFRCLHPQAKQLLAQKSQDLLDMIKEELNVKEVKIKPGPEPKAWLDTKITPALAAEGAARELIRQIQVLRRQAGLGLTDKITITAPDWPKEWEKEILLRTNAQAIQKGRQLVIKPFKTS